MCRPGLTRRKLFLLVVIAMTMVLDRHGQVKTIAANDPPLLQFPHADEVLTASGQIRRKAGSINAQTYADLVQLLPPARYSGNPIIAHGGGGWKNHQVEEPAIIVDPYDSTSLIMYFSGMSGTIPPTNPIRIGRATASIATPHTWTEYGSNPIIDIGAGGAWDSNYIRVDSVLYNASDDTIYLYYTGNNGSIDQIGLATSPGNDGIAFTKYAGNPILTPTSPETWVSQGAVIKDGSNWYMWYAHRDGADTLPGIKVATSSDGKAWTHTGTTVWSRGSTYDSTYIEWHQVFKFDSKFIFLAECYDGSVWTAGLAYSTTYNGAVTKLTYPAFSGSGTSGAFDQYHIATPAIYHFGQQWYLYYQGGNVLSPYGNSTWDLGVADLR